MYLEGNKLAIEFVRRRSATNLKIEYRAVFADSLDSSSDWETSGTTTTSPIDDVWERVKVLDSVPMNTTSRRFTRLEVERTDD